MDEEWMLKYYEGAVGLKITSVEISEDGFPVLMCKKGNKVYKLEVSQDEEGNGAGFLFGLPMPHTFEKI